MLEKSKIFPTFTFYLGIICVLWIIYDIYKIYSDLRSVLFQSPTSLIMLIGYFFILIFHLFVIVLFFRYFKGQKNSNKNIILLFLIIFSIFMIMVEKVMFDEVGHEYYIEFPAPGEVIFLYFGLFINASFIIYSLYLINQKYKIIRFNSSTTK